MIFSTLTQRILNQKKCFIFKNYITNFASINKYFLDELQDDYKEYSCFIETGTLNGDTILALEPHFNKLYTIELSEKYYTNTKNKYDGNKIDFILGDSSIVFESLLPTIVDKCIFF